MIDSLASIFSDQTLLTAIAWLAYTLVIYAMCVFVYRKLNQSALLHPLLLSTTILLLSFHFVSVSIEDYQQATQLYSFLLGPATVALAIPLYNQLRLLVSMSWRVLVPVAFASAVAPILSWYSLYLFDAPLNLQMTVLVKSITTPLAMDTAAAIGGVSALAAIIVISTGISGAVCGPVLFKVLKIHNHAAQGTALGSVAHAIGIAKAISISDQATAFATLALCVNGIVTSILLPVLFAQRCCT